MKFKRHLLAMVAAFLFVAVVGVLTVYRPVESAVVYGITVGDFPQYTTLVGSKIYTSNRFSNNVSVLDTATNAVIATIPVGTTPVESILVGTSLYVSNSGNGTVSVIDTTTDTVTATIAVGSGPWSSTLVGTNLYVNNHTANTVSVIDTLTNTVTATITVGNGTKDSVLVGTSLYVTNQSSNSVSVIDTVTNLVIATIPVPTAPVFIVANGTNVYVLNQTSNQVRVIDTLTNTITATIPTATQPVDAIVVGTDLYVAHFNAASVSVIDLLTNTVTQAIPVGTAPGKLISVSSTVYVLNRTTDNVSVIDTVSKTVTATVAAGDLPIDAEIVGPYLYMSNGSGDNVYILDTNTNTLVDVGLPTIVSALVSGNVLTLVYDEPLDSASVPANGDFQVLINFAPANVVLVSVTGSQVVLTLDSVPGTFDTVSVSYTVPGSNPTQDVTGNNAATLGSYPVPVQDCGSITVGGTPIAGTVVGTKFYVFNYGSGNVSVIDLSTNTVIATIPAGAGVREGILVGTKLYAINSFTDTVTVIDTVTDSVVATVPTGSFPVSARLAGTSLYVSNQLGNTFSVIDTVTDTVSATIPGVGGGGPSFLQLVGTDLYYLDVTPNEVSVIDTLTNTITDTISVGSSPQSLVLVGTQLYVANAFGNTVSVIDTVTKTVTDTIAVGTNPAVTVAVGTKLYVTNANSNNISVIDTVSNTVIATTTVGAGPALAALSGTDLYVAMQSNNSVYVIDTNTDTVTDIVPGMSTPYGLNLAGSTMYVINLGGPVKLIDTATKAVVTCAVSLMHTLTYTAGANGSIVGTSPQTVVDGANGTAVTAVPNPGYAFTQWSDASTANPRTDTNVLADLSVTANFVTLANPGSGGSTGCVGQECGDTLGPEITNVRITELTTSTARITWETSEPATTAFYFGLNDGYGSGYRGNASLVLEHSVLLTGLSEGTVYHYQLEGVDTRGNRTVAKDASFATATEAEMFDRMTITDVEATLITDTTAVITWKTNVPLNSRVDYGTSTEYGGVATNDQSTMSHLVSLSGLMPNTPYHYRVSSGYGTSVISSVDQLLNTLVQVIPPANPLDFAATGEVERVRLSWKNPTEEDFSFVKILARPDRYPNNPTDGALVYEGNSERAAHLDLMPRQEYFYTIFAYDKSFVRSSGAIAVATTLSGELGPEPEVVPPAVITPATPTTTRPIQPRPITGSTTSSPTQQPPTSTETAPVVPSPEVAPPEIIPSQPDQEMVELVEVPATHVVLPEAEPSLYQELLQVIESLHVSPKAVGAVATAAAIASLATVANLFSYLGYLFSQPLMLIGARLRKKWGVVYNSITKQGMGLVVVRLVDAASGRVLQTRVTDENGRYFFHVKPGQYRIEATKAEHVFPSVVAGGLTQDDEYLDIYHGTPITVENESDLMMNIPIDPNHHDEQNRTVLFKRFKTKVQYAISALSFGITAIAFVLQPGPVLLGLVLLQIATYLLFRKLVAAHKPKNWGVVSEAGTNKTVKDAVVRIFDKQYNKLLETQVTDSKGRYGFLAGKNRYFVTADKQGYLRYTSPDIDLTRLEEQTIERPITLQKVTDATK